MRRFGSTYSERPLHWWPVLGVIEVYVAMFLTMGTLAVYWYRDTRVFKGWQTPPPESLRLVVGPFLRSDTLKESSLGVRTRITHEI